MRKRYSIMNHEGERRATVQVSYSSAYSSAYDSNMTMSYEPMSIVRCTCTLNSGEIYSMIMEIEVESLVD